MIDPLIFAFLIYESCLFFLIYRGSCFFHLEVRRIRSPMCVRASEEALVRVPCTCEDEKRNTGKHFESPTERSQCPSQVRSRCPQVYTLSKCPVSSSIPHSL